MYPAPIETDEYEIVDSELETFRRFFPHGSILELEQFMEARHNMKQIEIIPIEEKEKQDVRWLA